MSYLRGASLDHFLIDPHELGGHVGPVELRRPPRPCHAQASSELRVLDEPFHGRRDGVGVARLDQETGHISLYDTFVAVDVAGDDGSPAASPRAARSDDSWPCGRPQRRRRRLEKRACRRRRGDRRKHVLATLVVYQAPQLRAAGPPMKMIRVPGAPLSSRTPAEYCALRGSSRRRKGCGLPSLNSGKVLAFA